MNASRSFYENLNALPDALKIEIYLWDPTYHKVFATEESKLDVRRMSQKIKQSVEFVKRFIESTIASVGLEWGYISRNTFFWISLTEQSFGPEIKILLQQKEDLHTKYNIVCQPDACMKDYDGFICNEEQHELYDNEKWFKHEGKLMKLTAMDIENGLYLYAEETNILIEPSSITDFVFDDDFFDNDFFDNEIFDNEIFDNEILDTEIFDDLLYFDSLLDETYNRTIQGRTL